MPPRSTVGHLPLEQGIGVRIPGGQPNPSPAVLRTLLHGRSSALEQPLPLERGDCFHRDSLSNLFPAGCVKNPMHPKYWSRRSPRRFRWPRRLGNRRLMCGCIDCSRAKNSRSILEGHRARNASARRYRRGKGYGLTLLRWVQRRNKRCASRPPMWVPGTDRPASGLSVLRKDRQFFARGYENSEGPCSRGSQYGSKRSSTIAAVSAGARS